MTSFHLNCLFKAPSPNKSYCRLRFQHMNLGVGEWERKSLSRVQFFAAPWTMTHQAPLSMEFSRQECWSGLPSPSPGDLTNPGIEPGSPALQADCLPSEPAGKSGVRGGCVDTIQSITIFKHGNWSRIPLAFSHSFFPQRQSLFLVLN